MTAPPDRTPRPSQRLSAAARIVSTPGSEMVLGHDGVLRIEVHPGAPHDEDEARRVGPALTELLRGKKAPAIADAQSVGLLDKVARDIYADTAAKHLTAIGIVVRSSFSRIVAQTFIRLGRPKIPVQIFESETEALAWLKDLGLVQG